MPLEHLLEQGLEGDHRSLAHLASIIERQSAQTSDLLALLKNCPSHAQVVGVTGPPGAGKSSLLAALGGRIASSGQQVAIIAIDPTSPLTGGATLGDRIRMSELATRPNVFVRSMASRSSADGLAPSAVAMARLFAAAPFQYVFLETVGTGQNQVAVSRQVDTLILVEAPGLGDSVQMLKAGIMEVADIYVVNKSDLPGAHIVARELRAMLTMGSLDPLRWRPPVLVCSTTSGEGVPDLLEAIREHREFLGAQGASVASNGEMARMEVLSEVQRLAEQELRRDPDCLLKLARNEISARDAAISLVRALAQDQTAGS